ncbi:Putative tRNA pseudouridine 55 synthase [Prochlorococcus marinus str. MIT 9515]|uniref:tRNA pseudouridine synthase B n=1 Tax=Prochlorococcus marinus (strain MIT 9515) TaxID=167542 RepID=TRUB_PROM5|nr:tRNA pseudouridine(55) synthase TruB [Prochlorococcus marinus]A2BY54.1 RecName: Full=tRNA pseudouridine synthase B; AltName: Full=tRNA pseudouridine(55) synthase; Short=Psi55 synthase; AltName: Full=tRNA pseudouridylate synthase; AltName: Full=tRNA-uridine isomerase [Prochlorococcus marinus str. MIT 9515]ABM72715.1 Putative tRNA pseudouridine 55 synthase [Prochlorococcus marinus str. MIT 9515]
MEIKDGFIIINKEKGYTSHDCVQQIRKLLGTKKVGHTGTLDPGVTGTLPIAIGSATRFIQYLPQGKTYIGQIQLGIRTKTDDIQGEIINKKEWPILSNAQLDKFLNKFRGIIQQIPPKVSSVHVNGERAYKKFFKNEEFELKPREVKIEELVLKKWDQINGILEIKISCSTGTYIRSIARDLGGVLDSEGCLLNLKRISACGFHEKNSIKISDLVNLNKNCSTFIIPTIYALDHISTLILNNQEEINFWETGRLIKLDEENLIKSSKFDYKKPIKIINNQKMLLGIGFINEDKNKLHPKLVLNAK